MNKMVCPSCGEELKEAGFYLKQYVNYVWDESEKRHVIEDITSGEVLSTCCDAEIEDFPRDAETTWDYYKAWFK